MTRSEDRAGDGGKVRRHHAPFFPAFHEKSPRWHDIAFLQYEGKRRGRLLWSGGLHQHRSLTSYADWKDEMYSNATQYFSKSGRRIKRGLDCYVLDISSSEDGFPWLYEALRDTQDDVGVGVNKNNEVTGLHIRRGNTHISVGSISHWSPNFNDSDPMEVIDDIQQLGYATGAGVHISPGSLGEYIMRRSWTDGSRGWPVITRPPDQCRSDLIAHTVGGRAEIWERDRIYEVAYEYDLRNAYASCCIPIPWGSITFAYDCTVDYLNRRFATYFARCTVRWNRKLPISPIAVRGRLGSNKTGWIYPNDPSIHGEPDCHRDDQVWLWREEIEAAIAAGIEVDVLYAYCWDEMSNRLSAWVHEMDSYRNSYEANGRPDQADRIKSCIVAAIGRLGMSPYRRLLISGDEYSDGDLPLVHKRGKAPITTDYVHVEYQRGSTCPVHVWSHILMKCRLKLYDRERLELMDGNELILSNFDAYYAAHPSRLETGTWMGAWRQTEHHDLVARYNRGIVSQERQTLPGIPRVSTRRRAYVVE